MSKFIAPAGFWPRRPKPEEASWRSPHLKEENFTIPEKISKNRARKVLPKSSQGIAETSLGVKETLEGVWEWSLCMRF